jgi:hypothetical protein
MLGAHDFLRDAHGMGIRDQSHAGHRVSHQGSVWNQGPLGTRIANAALDKETRQESTPPVPLFRLH